MRQCAAASRDFFERAIALAARRGHSVKWNPTCFSVRREMPSAGRPIAYAFCYPNGKFEFYFADLPLSNEQKDELRQRLMEFGVLQKSKTAEKTIHAIITEENIADLHRVYDFILDRMDEIP